MEASHNRIFIFLDIDGVLNTASQWKRMYQLDDGTIARFSEYARTLSEKGDVRIILTSSWKNGFDPAGRHSPQIRELIEKLAAYGLSILSKTENDPSEDRAKEINDYIKKHRLEQEECIIIDDDPNIFHVKLANNCTMFLTDANVGFQEARNSSSGDQGMLKRIVRIFKQNDSTSK